MELSVVIIIYNVEKYLRQCIESVLSQTYTDFELILVDDGSPDNCPQICDEYSQKDSRIRVLHQKNQGSVMARWNGMLAAQGKYISLIDGDDWLDSDMYEKMMQLAFSKNADIVIAGYKQGTEENYTLEGNTIESGIYSGEALKYLYSHALYMGSYYEPGIAPSLCTKVFRRDLFFKNYEHPHPIIRMGEDAAVSYPLIARAETIVIANEIHSYNYRIVENSMSRKFDPSYFDRCIELFRGLSISLKNNKEMYNDLKFYTLFLIEIGIGQLTSKKSGYSLLAQKRIIDTFYQKYIALDISRDYDWGLIPNEKKWLRYLMQGKTLAMMFKLYIHKILRKIIK